MKKIANANFIYENRHPDEIEENTYAASAVNAVSKALDLPWETVYRSLIAQSLAFAHMPENMVCVNRMLRDHSFFLYPKRKIERLSADTVCAYMQKHCQSGVSAIVRVDGNNIGGDMLAIAPAFIDGKIKYKIFGVSDCSTGYLISEIWLHWSDGGCHCPDIPKPRSVNPRILKSGRIPASHEFFEYRQENPLNRTTKDCVLRAIASACEISWNEVLDRLSKFRLVTVNHTYVIENLLHQMGYVSFETDPAVTGTEFCRIATRYYQNGERLILHLGNAHMAAMLPYQTEKGVVQYRITDNYDSSNETVTKYWVHP